MTDRGSIVRHFGTVTQETPPRRELRSLAMRRRLALTAACLALVGSACGSGDDAEDSTPASSTRVVISQAPPETEVAPTSPEAPPETQPPQTTSTTTTQAMGFDRQAWIRTNATQYQNATADLNEFVDATKSGEPDRVETAARLAGSSFGLLAVTLEGDQDAEAVELRAVFTACELAYTSAAEAVSNLDMEAVSASTVLIQRCTEGFSATTP